MAIGVEAFEKYNVKLWLNRRNNWDVPCFTYYKANIYPLNGLKENFVLGFLKERYKVIKMVF